MRIKRYLADIVPSIAQSIAFGIGRDPESVDDTRLGFEIARIDVSTLSYDFLNDRLIFKAAVPDALLGEIHEVGLYTSASNIGAGQYGSKVLLSFDSATEPWADAIFTVDEARIGGDSLTQAPDASQSVSNTLSELYFDLSGHSGADTFLLAANVGNNVSNINITFATDSANYYSISLGAQSAGYRIIPFTKSSVVATGSPAWSQINSVEITTTAGSGGAASIDFDGLRIEDIDTVNTDYALVSREVLATPYIKRSGMVEEIEVSLGVTI